MILFICNLQVTLMLPTKFQVSLPLGSEEVKNRFSRWQPWWPSWISDRTKFSCMSSRCFLPIFKSVGLSVQEKKQKIDFQDDCLCGHLGFPIGTVLATSNLQISPMLSAKFQVNWPFDSGEEAKNRFSRWWPW